MSSEARSQAKDAIKCASFIFFSFLPLLSVGWSGLHRMHFFFEKALKANTLNGQKLFFSPRVA